MFALFTADVAAAFLPFGGWCPWKLHCSKGPIQQKKTSSVLTLVWTNSTKEKPLLFFGSPLWKHQMHMGWKFQGRVRDVFQKLGEGVHDVVQNLKGNTLYAFYCNLINMFFDNFPGASLYPPPCCNVPSCGIICIENHHPEIQHVLSCPKNGFEA